MVSNIKHEPRQHDASNLRGKAIWHIDRKSGPGEFVVPAPKRRLRKNCRNGLAQTGSPVAGGRGSSCAAIHKLTLSPIAALGSIV
jgi:hypothetical protein